MRVLIQRVSEASVWIEDQLYSEIGHGLLIFLGIEEADTVSDLEWLAGKIARLRIFSDENQAMNLSVKDVGGQCLVVSQFTLHAQTRKGNRPSFIRAARPETAVPLYNQFLEVLQKETGRETEAGKFGAMMEVKLINDGPVTIWMDSKNRE